MKASELMIGDWVYNTHNRQNEQVAEIGSGLVVLAYNDLYEYDEVEPIPLTPEILEKNGFTKDLDADETHYWFTLIDEHISFSILYVRSVFQWLGPLDFKYIHELQHALKLCGIKKEIEL